MELTTNVASAVSTVEMNGTAVNRLFPIPEALMNYDPFVLWDHFELKPDSGFPEHPHRGFEAITYLFEGSIEHRDNLKNRAIVHGGGAQRFTAGKGLIHSEMPASNVISKGIQVWINLPKNLKQTEPSYQQINDDEIREEEKNGLLIRIISADNEGIHLNTLVQFLDILFRETTEYDFLIPSTQRGFVYVVDGSANIKKTKLKKGDAFFFEQETNHLSISASQGTRIMLISGKPHKQPIYQHGTFVD